MLDRLLACFGDPSEKIRATTCDCVGNMDLDIIAKFVSKPVLEALSMRCKDSKVCPHCLYVAYRDSYNVVLLESFAKCRTACYRNDLYQYLSSNVSSRKGKNCIY